MKNVLLPRLDLNDSKLTRIVRRVGCEVEWGTGWGWEVVSSSYAWCIVKSRIRGCNFRRGRRPSLVGTREIHAVPGLNLSA